MYILCTKSSYELMIKCFLFLQECSFGVEHYVTAPKNYNDCPSLETNFSLACAEE